MGSIISAIYDDEKEYEELCRKYGERPHMTKDGYGRPMVDCYGPHARELATLGPEGKGVLPAPEGPSDLVTGYNLTVYIFQTLFYNQPINFEGEIQS